MQDDTNEKLEDLQAQVTATKILIGAVVVALANRDKDLFDGFLASVNRIFPPDDLSHGPDFDRTRIQAHIDNIKGKLHELIDED